MDAPRQLPQLGVRGVEIGGRLVQQRAGPLRLRVEEPHTGPQLEPERDEALLRAVVEITCDLCPGRVGGLDDTGTRAKQLFVGVRARQAERDELGEGAEPVLGALRQRHATACPADRDCTPEPALDLDGGGHCEREAGGPHARCELTVDVGPFEPLRTATPEDARDRRVLVERDDGADVEHGVRRALPAPHHLGGACLGVVAQHPGGVGMEEASDLLGGPREDLGRRSTARDERCDTAKHRLLVREGGFGLDLSRRLVLGGHDPAGSVLRRPAVR